MDQSEKVVQLCNEREQCKQEIARIQQRIAQLNAEIIQESAPFRVGDRVADRGGISYQISDIMVKDGDACDQFTYWGYRVKSGGTLSTQKLEIYQLPLMAIHC